MVQVRKGPGVREALVSWAIIGALVVIAVGVYVKQFFYDPTIFRVGTSEQPAPVQAVDKPPPPALSSSAAALPSPLNLEELLPSDLKVLSHAESFGPETLSDKIDGKAELYLAAGFVSLVSQRFVKDDDPVAWVEIFVYDMGTHKHAYSVYSAQRRSEAESSDLAPYAYKTTNALYWVHGKHYLEAIASVPSPILMESITAFGKQLISAISGEADEIVELGLFPRENLAEGSITLLSKDVFGFQDFENVYTARYNPDGQELTAFLSLKESPEKARKLVEAYHAFLLENGGVDSPLEAQIPGAVLVKIMDTFELIFHHGPCIAGVHEADDQVDAEKLAARLEAKLTEALK